MFSNSSYLAHVDYGDLILEMGDTNGALAEFQQAIQWAPNPAMSSELHTRLGNVLAGMGRFAEATNEFFQAMRLAPAASSPHLQLGSAFAAHDDLAGATNEFSEALRLAPSDPAPLVEWGKALLQQGRDAEAIDKLREAQQLAPDNFQTLTFLARVLAGDEHSEIRNGSDALALAQKADALTGGGQPLVKDVLGMAFAETGQFDEAQQAATDAIRLATAAGMKSETIAAMQERWQLYQKHQPWRVVRAANWEIDLTADYTLFPIVDFSDNSVQTKFSDEQPGNDNSSPAQIPRYQMGKRHCEPLGALGRPA